METRNYGNQTLGSVAGTGSAARIADVPPESASGIRDAISGNEELCASLHASISHLESRLDTALTPIPPSPATTAAGNKPTPIMSNVRERLDLVNQRLNEALMRLNALRDRIEI